MEFWSNGGGKLLIMDYKPFCVYLLIEVAFWQAIPEKLRTQLY